MLRKLMISCGGTGGHFYPGLAVARVLAARGGEVKLLLSGIHAPDQKDKAKQANIEATALPRMPHVKRNPFQFLAGFIRGFFVARREFKCFRPDALLLMGSFASLPVFVAAFLLKVPIYLHDGNARIGKANRKMSRCARMLGVAFPPVNAGSCHTHVILTGMPLRPELEAEAAAGCDKAEAVKRLNAEFGVDFAADCPIALVMGGSQGASVFNRTLPAALAASGVAGLQVIHLCGPGKLAETRSSYDGTTLPLLLLEYSDRMALLFDCADLVFARSGGSTVAELGIFGKPAVLTPYPYAAEGHQTDNAGFYVASGGGVEMPESELSVDKAAGTIDALFAAPGRLSAMAEAARKGAYPHAAENVLEMISNSIGTIR